MATFGLVTAPHLPLDARLGVYPGSFNPPTDAHHEIALTAREHHGLHRVDFAVSTVTLGKESVMRPPFEERLAVIEASIADVDGLGLIVTEHQLIADIAGGYDVVVMGADKWAQVNDLAWYPDHAARDAALAALPALALAPRPASTCPTSMRSRSGRNFSTCRRRRFEQGAPSG